jgi:hypothetical protein
VLVGAGTDNYDVTTVEGIVCTDAVTWYNAGYQNPLRDGVAYEICNETASVGEFTCRSNFVVTPLTSYLPAGNLGDTVALPSPTSGTDFPVCNPNGGDCGVNNTYSPNPQQATAVLLDDSTASSVYQCTSNGWVAVKSTGTGSGGAGCSAGNNCTSNIKK